MLRSSVDEDVKEDIVEEEVSSDLDTSGCAIFSFAPLKNAPFSVNCSSLAWVEHVWASLTRLSTVVGTWGQG